MCVKPMLRFVKRQASFRDLILFFKTQARIPKTMGSFGMV